MADNYVPQDSMYLWWLGVPSRPRLIGQIALTERKRKVSLTYQQEWMAGGGFALSEDLPLHPGLFVPAEKDMAAGAVDDARPDRWGERVIRLIDKPARLSLLEYLFFAGDERTGALGVSLGSDAYGPCPRGAIPAFEGLAPMEEAIAHVLANEPVPEIYQRLLRPGASFGGARPKSAIQMDGVQWVVKFSEGESMDTPLVEHATMRLAARCGIRVAETRALPVSKGHAVAVQRFDRAQDGGRMHVISAHVALRACGEQMGYPELSQLLRRLGRPHEIAARQEELFRRMVFNILMDNTDDHEKNHALVRGADGYYDLTEAFDVVPSAQGLRYQQMRVGKDGAESTLKNALSESVSFGLPDKAALSIVKELCRVVDGWKEHFQQHGVRDGDIGQLENYLDASFLRSQRMRH